VYANEAKLAAGNKWHSMCFKCTACNKMLESTTLAEHEGSLYCKSCHGKHFGPKGYGYGQGAGVLSMDTGSATQTQPSRVTSSTLASEPQTGVHLQASRPAGGSSAAVEGGCPRCGKRVYEAEKKVAVGRNWHKSCFNCVQCHKSLDSTSLNDKDGEIYCKGCYGKAFGPKGVGYGIGAGTLQT
jgi:cysteine/glycine-rich protein